VADPSIPGGHADSFSTSISLYLRPESVRKELIANPKQREVNWSDPKLDFSRYSPTGVIGNPTHSSAELGKKLWEESISEVASIFVTIAKGGKSKWLESSRDRLHFLHTTKPHS
jgi:creatinine amidohydrolase